MVRSWKDDTKAVIAYHFFPHYREGILQCLSGSEDVEYKFVGDISDPDSGIEGIDISEGWIAGRFRRARCLRVSRLIWQPGLLARALSSGADTWIILSLPKNISVWTTAVAGRLLRRKVVFWAHGWIRRYNTRRDTFRKLFFRLPSSMLLYGHRAKALAIEDGFPAERIHVVYNSMNHAKQRKLRAQPGAGISIDGRREYFANPELPTLVCTSRLTMQRDLPLAFRALALLKAEGVDTNLLLLGDGPERARLEALAKELELNVYFVGACYDENKIARLVQLANLTIAPGKVGLTAMHSLTYGVPVITHSDFGNQMPESEAIIDGWNGLLFKRNDFSDLARVIRGGILRFNNCELTRERCYEVIDRYYNPDHQASIIKRAVRGESPLDDGWAEFVASRNRLAGNTQ